MMDREQVEKVAALLRSIQSEHGALPEGVRIIGPEWLPDVILGIPVVRGPTLTQPTLSCPATANQARDFEDYWPEDMT